MVQYSKFEKNRKCRFFNFNFLNFSWTITKIQDGGANLLPVQKQYLYSTPVHRDQLRAQCSVMSMGELYHLP